MEVNNNDGNLILKGYLSYVPKIEGGGGEYGGQKRERLTESTESLQC